MAKPASSPPPAPMHPRRISLAEESLLLPAQSPRFFAFVSLLIFYQTFLFLFVAVLRVHPLPAAILGAPQGGTDQVSACSRLPAILYLTYLANKFAAQAAAAFALAGCKLTIKGGGIRGRPFFFVIASALAAALELVASAALLLALTSSSSLLLRLGCFLLFLCIGTLLPVTIAASASMDEGYGVRGACRIAATMKEDAAVQALVASLLPVAVYPVYALFLEFARSNAGINPTYGLDGSESVRALGVLSYVYLLPSVGVQLYSAVAATVLYKRCREELRLRHVSTHHVPLLAVSVEH